MRAGDRTSELILGSDLPRIFTQPLRELTEETTDGFAAIAFAEDILGLPLFGWQREALLRGLELNEDGSYRFRVVIIEVARQAGKTVILVVLALWSIYCLGRRTVIATAQDLSKAEDAWSAAVEYAQSDTELADLIQKISLAHPKVFTVLHPSSNKLCSYRVASASRKGGRGFSGDLILMDELREHQSWDSWASVANAMNARPMAQAWAFSNAGDSLSVVLRYMRASAHRTLGWPDGDTDADVLGELDPSVEDLEGDDPVGWFEWSAPPTAARGDRHAWAQANPSLNHTEVTADCVTERALAANLRTQPGHVFDAECLCRWSTLSDSGPFPEGAWVDTLDNDARPAPDARSAVCVEVSTTRSAAVIVKAAPDGDRQPVVGVVEQLPGTDWIVPWLLANRDSYHGVVIRSSGSPVAALLTDMTDAGLPVIDWKAGGLTAAFGMLFDRVRDHTIRHLSHPGLDSAATSASVRVQPGGGWVVDPNRSPTDVAPLYAVAGAVWGLGHLPNTGPSIYSGPQGKSVLVI